MLDPQIAQVRRDPLTGDTILMACDRAARPNDFVDTDTQKACAEALPPADQDANCPFCRDNESRTREPRINYGGEDSEWTTRVVPNLYPAVDASIGFHGVVIESQWHRTSWEQLSRDEQYYALAAYQDQLQRMEQAGHPYAQIFKNSGEGAGASLAHSHSQIVASPSVPERVKLELAGAARYFRNHDQCFFCNSQQAGQEPAVALENEHFCALCPEASRFAYETWVLPKQHQSRFTAATSTQLRSLASLLHQLAGAISELLPGVGYNWLLHTSPSMEWLQQLEGADGLASPDADSGYHWHFEFIPRVAKLAGYELATQQFINIVKPEDAAESIQEAASRFDQRMTRISATLEPNR